LKKVTLIIVIVASVFLTASCTQEASGEELGYTALLELLTENGFMYTEGELDAEHSVLSVARKPLLIGDEIISVYEYASNGDMEKDSAYIDKNGLGISRPGGVVKITWISTPYFFKSGTLIVNYVGEDEQILSFLTEHYGSEIAGGKYLNG